MAVALDAAVAAGNVLSWSHTCSGSNRYLTVEVMIGSQTIQGSAVTYNGTSMTLLHREVSGSAAITTEIWGLVNPSSGAHTVSVTLSGSNPGCDNGSASFTGVDQTTPTDGASTGTSGTASAPSGSAKTGTSRQDAVISAVGATIGLTEAAGTLRAWNSGSGDALGYILADGTSQTVSYTGSGTWVSTTVLLKGDGTELPAAYAKGSYSSSTGTATPSYPSGIAAGDWLICVVESSDSTTTAGTPTTPSGWTKIHESTQGAGATGVTTLTVFAKIADGTESGTLSVTGVGNHLSATIFLIIGALATSTSDITVGTGNGAASSPSVNAITTPADNSLVVVCIADTRDANSTAQFSAWSNSNFAVTEWEDHTTTSGAGGGIGVAYGVMPTAGSTGAVTATQGSAGNWQGVLLAFQPVGASPQTVNMSGKGLASAQSFGTPMIATGGVNVSATGLGSGQSFGTPVAAPGNISAAPSGLASAQAFGTPTAAPGNANVTVTGLGSPSSFGSITTIPGNVDVVLTGLGSAQAFGSPTIPSGSPQNVSATGLGSASSFGSVTALPGNINASVSGIGTASSFGSVTVHPGGVSDSPSGLASAQAFGTPTVAARITISMSGLGSAQQFGAPTIAPGGTTVGVAGLGSAQQFGTLTIDGGLAPTFNPAVLGGRHHHR